MASEGVLTERAKFAQMKQEDQESVTAWKEELNNKVGDLSTVINVKISYSEINSYQGSTTRD